MKRFFENLIKSVTKIKVPFRENPEEQSKNRNFLISKDLLLLQVQNDI